MSDKSKEVVVQLGREVAALVELIPDKDKAALDQSQAKRLTDAVAAASTLKNDGPPTDPLELRRLEVALVGGLEAVTKLDLAAEAAIKRAAAWALYEEDMVRRKRDASMSGDRPVEAEINVPGDTSVN